MAVIALAFLTTAIPSESSAYPGAVDSFFDNTTAHAVQFGNPPQRGIAGTLLLPSNGTVLTARVTADPGFALSSVALQEDGAFGFAAGQPSSGLSVTGSGIGLALKSGSTEFSGTALDSGTFTGTARVGNAVVLTALSGTYDSPSIAWNGASFGHLIANFSTNFGGTLSFSIIGSGGGTLQTNVAPGALISANGSAYPTIKIRSTMAAPSVAASPVLTSVGAGLVLASSPTSSGATNTLRELSAQSGGLALNQSRLNFTTPFAGPAIPPVAGTWSENGIGVNSAVVVGTEIWLYVSGTAPSGLKSIFRMVSADGGQAWSPDSNPVLQPSASGWDSQEVGGATVLWNGGTDWRMWYMGFDAQGFDSGARVGYATSADGTNWTKYGSNPVLSTSPLAWDNYAVLPGGVVKVGSTYFMYYSGRDSGNYPKSVGVATSSDGITWSKFSGNPIIGASTAPYTSSEAYAGHAYYHDGTFYLYWMCAVLQPIYGKYRSCVSTSTDGFSFSHYSGNPIISEGEAAWDLTTTDGLTECYNPFDGTPIWFFTGGDYNNNNYLAIGRAFPIRSPSGLLTSVWDLRGEVPHRITAVRVSAQTPASTSVQTVIATGPTSSSFSVNETVALNDTSIVTAPDSFLRLGIAASSFATNSTPLIFSSRVEYDRYATNGTFVSRSLSQQFRVRDATVDYAGTRPLGTTVSLSLSNDDGLSWWVASPGVALTFPSAGRDLRYRVDVWGTSTTTPNVTAVNLAFTMFVGPTDVVLETQAGARLAFIGGELAGVTSVDLDAAPLNAILSAAPDSPVTGIYIDIFANSTTPGVLILRAPHITLSFPDELRAFFSPDAPAVDILSGAAQQFRVEASTTPGVAITYSWSLDGNALPAATADFLLNTTGMTLGTHTLRASASNLQFTTERSWALNLVSPPEMPTASFYPATGSFTLLPGASQEFRVAVSPASVGAAIAWWLDGGSVGSGETYTFVAPVSAGNHTLRATAQATGFSEERTWAIQVVVPPAVPARPLLVAFAPVNDIVLEANQTVIFWANLTEAATPPIDYEWNIYGDLPGTADTGSFTVKGGAPGAYAVWVTVRNETGIATHLWNLTVLPPPAAPPSGTSSSQTAGIGDAGSLLLIVIAAAAAAVFAALFVRERRLRPPP